MKRFFYPLFLFSYSLFAQVDYETQIQTIFSSNCTNCHVYGHNSGLNLTSYTGVMAGGNSGAVIVPGDHANSLLWQKVNSGAMPPGNNPDLSADEINLIAQWINEGALEIVGCADGEVELWDECYSIENTDSLDLTNSGLTGEIPPEIFDLTNLIYLNLGENQLTGSIPSEIGNLTNLIDLRLIVNQLTGSIPPEIWTLTNLEFLSLKSNQLTGEVPPEIGNLTGLLELNLGDNQLTGDIPPEIGNLTNLVYRLDLSKNQLTGEIPSEIGGLTNLEYLNLRVNQLHGEIPPQIGDLTNLIVLRLYDNQFTGELPPELWTLEIIEYLSIDGNQLAGEIPPEIGQLMNLQTLWLSENQFTGSIPSELFTLPNLSRVYLYDNQITGEIPSEIGNLPNLERLKLHTNQLTGSIPETLCDLSDLTWSLEDSSSSVSTLFDNQLCPPYPSCIENYVGEQNITECVYPVWHVATTGSDETGDGSEGSPFATIQKGVESSSDGDTIFVAAGTYLENINFNGKNIVVTSLHGTESTFIDGNQYGTVVTFENGEDSTAILSGFTITNGNGSGIEGYEGRGGGIFCISSSPTLKHLTVTGNQTENSGGGLWFGYSNSQLVDLVISNNSVVGYGSPAGGGISMNYNSDLTINNILVVGNEATFGAGIELWDSSKPTMNYITVVGNTGNDGGGVFTAGGCYPIINNSILWGNSPHEIMIGESDSVSISYSDISGGHDGIVTNDNGTVFWGEGNIDADPLFCDPENGNYYLAENSPCVGAGENGSNMGAFGIGCDAIILSTDMDIIPMQYILHQNYPNPFNPVTTLRYDLPGEALVNITIYDMMGRQVKTLINDLQTAGYKSTQWNATNDTGSPVSAGIYLYMIQAGDFRQTKKMVLLK